MNETANYYSQRKPSARLNRTRPTDVVRPIRQLVRNELDLRYVINLCARMRLIATNKKDELATTTFERKQQTNVKQQREHRTVPDSGATRRQSERPETRSRSARRRRSSRAPSPRTCVRTQLRVSIIVLTRARTRSKNQRTRNSDANTNIADVKCKRVLESAMNGELTLQRAACSAQRCARLIRSILLAKQTSR